MEVARQRRLFHPDFRRIRIVTFPRDEIIRRDVTNDNPEVFAYIKSPNGAVGGLYYDAGIKRIFWN